MARGMGAARSGLCRHGRFAGKPSLVQGEPPSAVTRVPVASHDDQAQARARSSRVELPLLVASDSQLCRGGDELEPANLDADTWIGAVGRLETGDDHVT